LVEISNGIKKPEANGDNNRGKKDRVIEVIVRKLNHQCKDDKDSCDAKLFDLETEAAYLRNNPV
jgi:hypothetical protein